MNIQKTPTKELLSLYKSLAYNLSPSYCSQDEQEWIEYDKEQKLVAAIKEELNTREHVLKPSQSKMIRKMSIHAGEKLTLEEAQLLYNKLARKAQEEEIQVQ